MRSPRGLLPERNAAAVWPQKPPAEAICWDRAFSLLLSQGQVHIQSDPERTEVCEATRQVEGPRLRGCPRQEQEMRVGKETRCRGVGWRSGSGDGIKERLGSEVRGSEGLVLTLEAKGQEFGLMSGYQVGVRNRKRMGRGQSEKSVPDLRSWVSAGVWTEIRGGAGLGLLTGRVGAVPGARPAAPVNPERDGAAEQSSNRATWAATDTMLKCRKQGDHEAYEDHS